MTTSATSVLASGQVPPTDQLSNLSDLSIILDYSLPFDQRKVDVFDAACEAMYGTDPVQRDKVHGVLTQFKQHPDSWRYVGTIVQNSKNINTKFLALSILENVIKTRWRAIPEVERTSIPQYVMNLSLTAATDPTLAQAKHLRTKINEIVIEIARREWPDTWPNFIPELCAAARTDQRICDNNLQILCMLSEEIFDFGEDQMTSRKCVTLKVTMASQFQEIFNVCQFIVESYAQNPKSIAPGLVSQTLTCLAHFLRWIPVHFIFDTRMPETLINLFWDNAAYRGSCVRCLTEIFSLKQLSDSGVKKLTLLWIMLMAKIKDLPLQTLEYDKKVPNASRVYWETFYTSLALCMTTFLRTHFDEIARGGHVCASQVFAEYTQMVGSPEMLSVRALEFVEAMTRVPNEETFKITIDFWHFLTEKLVQECLANSAAVNSGVAPSPILSTPSSLSSLGGATSNSSSAATGSQMGDSVILNEVGSITPNGGGGGLRYLDPHPEKYSASLALYQPVLNLLRRTFIARMAKPQEVYITYDEDSGTVDRDYEPDTAELSLYASIREVLIFLTNLGSAEMEVAMKRVLTSFTESVQRDAAQKPWNPMVLSRLTWAVGSISGAMDPTRETTFVVQVLKTLLWFCEVKRGKENKALVASQIMYVVGQYPRILRQNVNFLLVVLNKVFEFTHEKFPGVQDMAVETLLKICSKCKDRIAAHEIETSSGGKTLFIQHIIESQLPSLKADLADIRQVMLLYHALAHVVAALSEPQRMTMIDLLLGDLNRTWRELISLGGDAAHLKANSADNNNLLLALENSRKLTEILKINERVADATGTAYGRQFQFLKNDALELYVFYSSSLLNAVMQNGIGIMNYAETRELRKYKRAILRLTDSFVCRAGSQGGDAAKAEIAPILMPPIMSTIFKDYKMCSIPEARDHEVLALAESLVQKLSNHVVREIPAMFDYLFQPSLDMIKRDFHSFPDLRLAFYRWLFSCVQKCFDGLILLNDSMTRSIMEALAWGFKHEQPTIADSGLKTTHLFMRKIDDLGGRSSLEMFAGAYFHSILRETFSVLTDTLHTSGFKAQSQILQELIRWVQTDKVNIPDKRIRKDLVMQDLGALLSSAFMNLNSAQIEIFVLKCFSMSTESTDSFQTNIRDFLVQLKEFGGAEELFEMERLEARREAEEKERQRRAQSIPGFAVESNVDILSHGADM